MSNLTLSDQENLAFCTLANQDYINAINLYTELIETDPENKTYYWYLGLSLLLKGDEVEAQTTWMLPFFEATETEIIEGTKELIEVLQIEAIKQAQSQNYLLAWTIRQHLKEFNPDDLNNFLILIDLSLKLEKNIEEELTNLDLIELLNNSDYQVNEELLLTVLNNICIENPLISNLDDLILASVKYITKTDQFYLIIVPTAIKINYSYRRNKLAIELLKICLKLNPKNVQILRHLTSFYEDGKNYQKAIETAKYCYEVSVKLADRIIASHILIRALLRTGGYWNEALEVVTRHQQLLQEILITEDAGFDLDNLICLFTTTFYLPYFQDNPKFNHFLQNQILKLASSQLKLYNKKQIAKYQNCQERAFQKDKNKPLRIGYICHCFTRHSVGWLARGLLGHHNREQFEIYGYFINGKNFYDPIQEWYKQQMKKYYQCEFNGFEIAEQIYQDEIDILVDLDSLTLDITTQVMALKPAPIQVTWLGWDASGLPEIDYYIADNYVLPLQAQDYYTEKIWRLPNSYIAVDGFEVHLPSLRRDSLNIPNNGIIYYSGQSGFKRHPDTLNLQLKIISEVPNSYFLIKGVYQDDSIQEYFINLAKQYGIEKERLRFLPNALTEEIHRADLAIADIILDTYPYNGATTTLETLWMEIPLVTKVGEQFAARNSYTMMINAGINEGIAFNDQEYINWGVSFGKNEKLRQEVKWKLHQAKQRSPLWNAKQFTQEMEKAYQQMWQNLLLINKD